MLRTPEDNNKCLECGHETSTPSTNWQRPSPSVSVSRYRKAGGYPTRYFAIHLDGNLLACTVYKKGAEAVRTKLLELMSPAQGVGCRLTPEPDPGLDPAHHCPIQTPVSVELARENGFFGG